MVIAGPSQNAKGPVLLPLLGVIHGLLLLFVVFRSLCPAIHLADITAFRRRLSIRCRTKGLRLVPYPTDNLLGGGRLCPGHGRGATPTGELLASGAVLHNIAPLRVIVRSAVVT